MAAFHTAISSGIALNDTAINDIASKCYYQSIEGNIKQIKQKRKKTPMQLS